ncbi:MAG: hypothetical protein D6785_06035, partial [Planctomycetota bacterium]
KEGLYSTVSVEKYRLQNAIFLKNDGKIEGGVPIYPGKTRADMATQLLLSHLPLLFHSSPQNVLVIGLGSGVTSGAALTHPNVILDTVEIEPSVVEAIQKIPAFHPYLHGLFQNSKRSSIFIEDGRRFLKRTIKKYSVIISQPSDPWISGSSALFTQEFFSLAAKKLEQEGLFCQWIQLYHLSSSLFQSLVKTFQSVFPYTYIFKPYSAEEVLLVGSQSPFFLDVKRVQKGFQVPSIQKSLKDGGIQDVKGIFLLYLMGPEEVRNYVKNAVLNRDDNLYIETRAPLYRYSQNRGREILKTIMKNPSDIGKYLQGNHVSFTAQLAIYFALIRKFGHALPLAQRLYEETKRMDFLRLQGDLNFFLEKFQESERLYLKGIQKGGGYHFYFNLACLYTYQGDFHLAKKTLKKLLQIYPTSKEGKYLLHLLSTSKNRLKEKLSQKAWDILYSRLTLYLKKTKKLVSHPQKAEKNPSFTLLTSRLEYCISCEEWGEAHLVLNELRKTWPHHWKTRFLAGWLDFKEGRQKKGIREMENALKNSFYDKKYLFVLGEACREAGFVGWEKKWLRKYAEETALIEKEGLKKIEAFRLYGDYELAIGTLQEMIHKMKSKKEKPASQKKRESEIELLYFRLLEIAIEEYRLLYSFKEKGFPSLPLESFLAFITRRIARALEKRLERILWRYMGHILKKYSKKESGLAYLELRKSLLYFRDQLPSSPFRDKVELNYISILLKIGQKIEAKILLKGYLKRYPNSGWALYHYAFLLEKEGKRKKAWDLYQKVIQVPCPFYLKEKAGKAIIRLSQKDEK